MRLVLFNRIRFAYSHIELWLGMLFLLVGIFLLASADWSGIYFYTSPVAITAGRIVTSYKTNFIVDEINVRSLTYRYQLAGLEWAGNSFTTDSTMQVGMAAPVEYCAVHPSISRLKGTRATPFGFTGLLAGVVFILIGGLFLLRSSLHVRRLLTIIDDAAIAEATRQRTTRRMPYEDEAEFILHYLYQAAGQWHTLCVETANDNRYSSKEMIVFAKSAPANSVLLNSLPVFIRAIVQRHN
jgi:hypothetical protein